MILINYFHTFNIYYVFNLLNRDFFFYICASYNLTL